MVKAKSQKVKFAVIGGSGLYEIPGIEGLRAVRVKTPFGDPSDAVMVGRLSGVPCAFLPRHGRGHKLLPGEIPSRANIYALKSLGVEHIIGVGACGSLKEELAPRHFVFPDQVFDRTKLRPSTFFGGGVVAHVSFDQPFFATVADVLAHCAREVGVTVHKGGTYICMEGPAFSTKAESQVNRAHGFSVVGMTVLPEAKLAREAEMSYTCVSLVTDYDVWKEGEEVSVQSLLATLHANVDNVKEMIKKALPRLARPDFQEALSRGAHAESLRFAIFTQPVHIPAAARKRLDLLVGKYLPKKG